MLSLGNSFEIDCGHLLILFGESLAKGCSPFPNLCGDSLAVGVVSLLMLASKSSTIGFGSFPNSFGNSFAMGSGPFANFYLATA